MNWNPYPEHKPKFEQVVRVIIEHDEIFTARFTKEKGFLMEWDGAAIDEFVTYWKPLEQKPY